MDIASLSFPGAPSVKVPPPGPASRALLDRQAERESNARTYPRGFPFGVARARGATIEDVDGNVYLDGWAGAGTLCVGHNHPDVVAAATEQMGKAIHTLDLPSPTKDRFTTKILSLLPEGLRGKMKVHFAAPTGADATEAAIKLVKTATGRRSILSFQGGYHGMTHGALSVTGSREPKDAVANLMPDVHFMPYGFCYRCALGLKPETCDLACAKFTESVLADPSSGVTKPAGIIIEAVQGEGGSVPAPVSFLRRIAEIAKAHDVPLIVDEIQAGMGRTGKWFAFEHAGIEPDVILMSKAIGGGGFPMALVLYRKELDVWKPGAHVGTFRGFLPAMAAGVAAIEFMESHGIVAHVANVGARLKAGLTAVAAKRSFLGECRGLGFMLGVEVLAGDGTKTPSYEKAKRVRAECLRRGLIVELAGRHDGVVRFIPPLVFTAEHADTAIRIFDEATAAVEAA
jgi:diaminobutyrate-2-oxoglutarate transaminase